MGLRDPFTPLLLLGTWQGLVLWAKSAKNTTRWKVESLPWFQGAEKHWTNLGKKIYHSYKTGTRKLIRGQGSARGWLLLVSPMVCTFSLLCSLCLSSKICLPHFPLFINEPILQSKCQKELVLMTCLNHTVPLGRALCPRHLHEPLASWWTDCLRPGVHL